ncbi:MBL fold metallo-hydrolase [Clostridium aestuarii]|uniref:MBL fold metallo-hydrolase n=1 Tax=Clostridium aestuarii TaxID=338193 RepID=A0ABT4CXP5_9CLOT|nr:MBL fold metallo-hydrolase [Clostridium aestuarii]MCY6483627.1 MBL fold metallo-hydrolase [Clostridium aestuarii]
MNIKRIPVGMYAANCYILIDDERKEACIIDPGGDAELLIKEINNSGIEVKFILLTHGHMDHTAAVEEIKQKYDLPVYISNKDRELMGKEPGLFGQMWKITKDDKTINDGEILKVGNLEIRCIETGGHTPGGMCFLVNDVMFTGDTLFQASIGRTDFPGGDFDQLINNIKTKLMILPDNIVILPGHGSESNIKFERENNPFL